VPLGLPDFRVPPSDCPLCGTEADGALATTGLRGPEEGDAFLCSACGTWGIFTATLARRFPTSDEAEAIALSPNAQRVRWAWETSR
jgi:hypothetical protein